MFVCFSDKNNVKNLCDIFLQFIKMPFVFELAVNLFLFILINLTVTFFYCFLSQNVTARHY